MTQEDPRVALVTGGTRGIGRGIVSELRQRGIDVALTYVTSAEEAQTMVAADPVGLAAFAYDLATGDPGRLFDAVERELGPLASLVLNAGTWTGGTIERLDEEEWWSVVEVNLRSAHRLCRAAARRLERAENASILLMSSVVGINGFAGDTAYASSKAAMIGFARSLAKELARSNVRVNVLAPGFVETDMTSAVPASSRDRIAQNVVLRRFGTVREIAKAAVFLSEDATYTTGSVLVADGGWSI